MSKKLLTVREAAQRLLVTEAYVYTQIREGGLPAPVATRVGKCYRIDSDELDAWLASGGTLFQNQGVDNDSQ